MGSITFQTSRFGEVQVDESTLLNFVSPILGFEHIKQFALLDHSDNSPFKWLQAVQDEDLAFVVSNPKFFGIPFEFSIPDDAVEKLKITSAEEVIVITIVNIPNDDPTKLTGNLMAPIIINQSNLYAMQVVLQDGKYSTKTPFLPAAKSAAGKEH